jgi:hypothetical protein
MAIDDTESLTDTYEPDSASPINRCIVFDIYLDRSSSRSGAHPD